MTQIAFHYNAIGFSLKGVGLGTSNLMFAIGPSSGCAGEVYTINQIDAENSTFIGASVRTPKGGLEVPGFPRNILGKVLTFGTPGEISVDPKARNKVEIKIAANDGRMTEIFRYEKFVPGMWVMSPGEVKFEGIAAAGYASPMRPRLLEYLFA